MAQGEYFNGFSTFKIEMVTEFDYRGNVGKLFLGDVRQDETESQGETFFRALAKKQQQESFETGSVTRRYNFEKVQMTGITAFAGMIYL